METPFQDERKSNKDIIPNCNDIWLKAPIGIVITDKNATVLAANSTFFFLFGL